MAGPVRQPEALGERPQAAVGNLVAHQTPGEGDGVDRGSGQRCSAAPLERGLEEPDVEADVVADHRVVADELLELGQLLDRPGSARDHGVGDAR